MDGYRLAVARGAVWRSRSDKLMAARSNRMSRRIKTAEAYSRGSADDLFAALAPLLRVRPVLEDFCRFGGPWRAPHEAAGNGLAYFHIVTRGSCRIERRDSDVITLEAGDVLLLPHGEKHVVGSCTKGPAGTITIEYRNAIRAKSTAGKKTDTEIICGRLRFEAGEDNVLVAALPDTMVLRTVERPSVERFRRILMDIREELDSEDPGSNLIATNLASALFVMMIRLHLQQVPERRSMLSLLQNRATSRAVIAMLKAPSKDWTLDDMAAAAVTSRVTLVRAFRSACGLAPMAYLGALRLDLARRRLSETKDSMGEVAATVGYKSEGALSKAFLRRFGVRPGAVRQR
jgi:AraC family transcriptional regulator, activator of mtrCDE